MYTESTTNKLVTLNNTSDYRTKVLPPPDCRVTDYFELMGYQTIGLMDKRTRVMVSPLV